MHLKITVRKSLALIFSILIASVGSAASPASAQQPVVRGYLFWMNGCRHCDEVLEEILPPLEREYGDQLDIRLIEVVTQEDLDYLYKVAAGYGIPVDNVGVPFLIVGEEVLIGSDQIPQRLPDLIDRYLAAGGVDFPGLPGVEVGQVPGVPLIVEAIASSPALVDPPVTNSAPQWRGFSLAIAIMVGMVAALIYSGVALWRGTQRNQVPEIAHWQKLAFLMLTLVGLAVAGYLAYVETQSVAAVCGPVGDCNMVQSSPYAKLFGVLPIGVLGLIAYLALLGAWLWQQWGTGALVEQLPLMLFGMAFFGVLFSLYLTYLEPFVIGAVCIWCLTSAVIMTLLMLLTIRPVVRVLNSDVIEG